MSKEALGKAALIHGAVEGRYTVKEIARRLGLSERRVKQMKKAYREQGEGFAIHGNSGRHPANCTGEKTKGAIIALKKSDACRETSFTHFKELPAEREGIRISYTALCGILKNAGMLSKRKHRSGGRRFRRRKRRSAFGEMPRAGASSYGWFDSGRFIDGATGRITGLYFCRNECLMGRLEAVRQTPADCGLPLELYAGKAGIFFVNNKKQERWTVEETLAGRPLDKTQSGAIMEKQLGITMTSARTPQAKGRIGRLWGTLQDRLPVWLKPNGIAGMEQANGRLACFIAGYNARFAIEPESPASAFVPLDASRDLDKLLAVRYERTTDNCGCFSFQNLIFQIGSKKPLAKKKYNSCLARNFLFRLYAGKSITRFLSWV